MSAANPDAPQRTTLARRVCSGASLPGCGALIDEERWPWSGAEVVETHGVCDPCDRKERAAFYARQMAERGWVDCADCREPVWEIDDRDVEHLCRRCRALDSDEAIELAVEAIARPFPPELARQRFGSGDGEIPSSAIVSTLALRERESVLEAAERLSRMGALVVVAAAGGLFVGVVAIGTALAEWWLG